MTITKLSYYKNHWSLMIRLNKNYFIRYLESKFLKENVRKFNLKLNI